MDEQRGIWLLPTRGRLAHVQAFLAACRVYGLPSDLWLLVNRSDPTNYEGGLVGRPPGWMTVRVDADSMNAAISSVRSNIRGLPWVGIVCDDQRPATLNWHRRLEAAIDGTNLVAASDGGRHPDRVQVAHVVSGPLLELLGHYSVPGARHMFGDDMWEYLGQETGCVTHLRDVIVLHEHALYTGVADATTAHTNRSFGADEAAYRRWLVNIAPFEVAAVRALRAESSQGAR